MNALERFSLVVTQRADETHDPHPAALPSLTDIEALSVTQLVSGGDGDIAAHVRARAGALAGGDGVNVRIRCIAKALALVETQLAQVQALLAQAIARRDVEGATLLDRMSVGATKRMCALLQEHRAERIRAAQRLSFWSAPARVTGVEGSR
jgi:hypothetical protein